MVKASEATKEQTLEALKNLLGKMFDAPNKNLIFGRVGRFIILKVEDYEPRHIEDVGLGIIVTPRPLKSCSIYLHDSPEVAQALKDQTNARRRQKYKERKKK